MTIAHIRNARWHRLSLCTCSAGYAAILVPWVASIPLPAELGRGFETDIGKGAIRLEHGVLEFISDTPERHCVGRLSFKLLPIKSGQLNFHTIGCTLPFIRHHNSFWFVRIPMWVPFLLVMAATILLRRIGRLVRIGGRCGNCEYDLTGNISGICPECGTSIALMKNGASASR